MTKFSDLKLDPKVLKAVAEAGYETPTPIQLGAIPPALEGRDVLGIAQTGTGKTASFTLPMITLLGRGRARARMPRSLVLCPTRELAAQVAENFDTYASHTRLTKALLIGGVSFGEQDKLIDRGVDVLIATPGRLLDHFERGKLLLTGVQIMVVDEADRMLDMGFIPDIERIFQLTPALTRQTLFFSATMAPEIERITNTFLNAPVRIEVARQATTSETITQKLVELTPTRKDQSAKQKRELLRALIDAEGEGLKNAIIFCNRKTEVDVVAKSLKKHGYDAAPIHGDLDQRVRMATLDGFRDGTLRFLVASDVAARGLDIPAVSHVVNFDLPSNAEDYVHRIGRTGRAGRLGTAISIATPADEKYLAAIENLVKQSLPRAEKPEGFSLSEAAQSAPRERSERERGPRAGSRVRTRGRRSEATAKPAAEIEALPEAAEVAASPEPRRDERRDERASDDRRGDDRRTDERRGEDRGERRSGERGERNGERRNDRAADRNGDRREDRNGDRNSDRRDERRDDRKDDRRDDRRERYRDRDRGPAVLGMGDHVPEFLTTSFAEAIAITDARSAASARAEAAGADRTGDDTRSEAQPAERPARSEGDEAAPRSRSRRGRGRGRGTEAASDSNREAEGNAEAPVHETSPESPPAEVTAEATVEAVTEAPEAADAAPEAPAKPRRTRTRRKPAAELPEEREAREAEATPADNAEPAPVTADPAPDALPEERAAQEGETDGSTDTGADNAAEADAKPAPKARKPRAPRKPRATKAKADASDDAAPAAVPVAEATSGTVAGAE